MSKHDNLCRSGSLALDGRVLVNIMMRPLGTTEEKYCCIVE